MAVGVFDSGLGGLTVLDAVARRLPEVAFVYYGDNRHAPYGVRDAEDIFRLTCKGVERLWAEGCDLVILACNTASAVALRRMQESWVPPDTGGVLKIERAGKIKKDWAKEAELEKIKKAKLEDTKDKAADESEGEQ